MRFDYRSLLSSLWVEISTLAYETKTPSWPERLSVAYRTHIIQKKQMLKNQRYPQKSMFTATGGAHRLASCSAGVICRGCGVVTCNTQSSVYFKLLSPPNSWNSYSCHIVALHLFCCHCRRHSYLSGLTGYFSKSGIRTPPREPGSSVRVALHS